MAKPIPKTICLACPFNSLKSPNKRAYRTFWRTSRPISTMRLAISRPTPASEPCRRSGASTSGKKRTRSAKYCKKCSGRATRAMRISFSKLKLDRCSRVSARQCTSHLTMRSTKMFLLRRMVCNIGPKALRKMSKLSKITTSQWGNNSSTQVGAVCGRRWPKWPRNR